MKAIERKSNIHYVKKVRALYFQYSCPYYIIQICILRPANLGLYIKCQVLGNNVFLLHFGTIGAGIN